MKKNFKQLQLEEALKRLEILKQKHQLLDDVIDQFKADGTVFYSENQSKVFRGILYWISNKPEYVEIIKQFETKNDAIVYHAILSHTQFGDLLNLMYVSSHKQEWARDNKDLEEGYTFAYVKNLSDDICSEFGSIAIEGANGGISRYE